MLCLGVAYVLGGLIAKNGSGLIRTGFAFFALWIAFRYVL